MAGFYKSLMIMLMLGLTFGIIDTVMTQDYDSLTYITDENTHLKNINEDVTESNDGWVNKVTSSVSSLDTDVLNPLKMFGTMFVLIGKGFISAPFHLLTVTDKPLIEQMMYYLLGLTVMLLNGMFMIQTFNAFRNRNM